MHRMRAGFLTLCGGTGVSLLMAGQVLAEEGPKIDTGDTADWISPSMGRMPIRCDTLPHGEGWKVPTPVSLALRRSCALS